MITLTEKAADKLKEYAQKNNIENLTVRFGVSGGKCSGLSFSINFDSRKPHEKDNVFEQHGIKLVVDPKSFIYLNETTIDHITTLTESGFKFLNKNLTKRCGCGLSFSV